MTNLFETSVSSEARSSKLSNALEPDPLLIFNRSIPCQLIVFVRLLEKHLFNMYFCFRYCSFVQVRRIWHENREVPIIWGSYSLYPTQPSTCAAMHVSNVPRGIDITGFKLVLSYTNFLKLPDTSIDRSETIIFIETSNYLIWVWSRLKTDFECFKVEN